MTTTVNLRGEPDGALYAQLFRFATERSYEFRFITFDRWALGPQAMKLIAAVNKHIVGQEQVHAWPGTLLGKDYPARLWRLKTTPELCDVLLSQTSGFPDWGGALPEDPHFVRDDGTPFLAACSSEHDVWLELTQDEYHQFKRVFEFSRLKRRRTSK